MSGVRRHVHTSSTRGCALVLHCRECSITVSLFEAQGVQSKHKSRGDVAGTGLYSHLVNWLFRLTLLDL